MNEYARRRRERARRPKPQVSCTLCKSKKLRCDRKLPCGNCQRRPPGSCSYVSNANSGISVASPTTAPHGVANCDSPISTSRFGEQDECSFRDFTRNGKMNRDSVGSLCIDSVAGRRPILSLNPRLSSDESETRLIDNTHWETVLQDISTTQGDLDGGPEQPRYASSITESTHPYLLFNSSQNLSFQELVNSLPPKSTADYLVNLFTRGADIPPLPIHLPTFLKDYMSFWECPDSVSLPWLSILFSILTLALQFVSRSTAKIEGVLFIDSACKQFASRAADCLRISDYARPQFRTVEAMIMYLLCEHFWIGREHFRASLLLDMAINLAMRSGYHRDPSHYRQMSVFEGEMRRRSWSYLVQLDFLFASYLGLPSRIGEHHADTALPSNIADEDLHPGITILPPCQSPEVSSTILFLNYRLLLAKRLAEISGYVVSSEDLTYDSILKLDNTLDEQVKERPTWLEAPLDSELEMEDDLINTNRAIEVDILEQRARIILHRKFLSDGNGQHLFSRDKCVAAATRILQQQKILYQTSFNIDNIRVRNWRALSLMSEDCLLAATIMCFAVSHSLLSEEAGQHLENSSHDNTEMDQQLQLLRSCLSIFTDPETPLPGVERARDVIQTVLSRIEAMRDSLMGENKVQSRFTSGSLPLDGLRPPDLSNENIYEGVPADVESSLWFTQTSGLDPYLANTGLSSDPEFLQSMIEEYINGSDFNSWNRL